MINGDEHFINNAVALLKGRKLVNNSFESRMFLLPNLSGGIGVKILEVVDSAVGLKSANKSIK